MNKDELLKVLADPNDKLICVDLDGTLCHGEWWGPHHEDPEPDTQMIAYLWELYKKGAHIVIYTARQPKYYQQTVAWLIKHGVPFHGVSQFIKSGADCYIDDKGVHPSDINSH